MLRISQLSFFLMLLLIITGCKKSNDYPVAPVIKFEEFYKKPTSTGKDDVGVMVISFRDGDGDLGFHENDTLAPYDKKGDYYYNFIVKYFERQKGVLKEVSLPLTNNCRIPYLTPEGKNKVLSGNIAMDIFINNPLSTYDTIRFEVFIYDRALHKSNVVQTTDIVVNK